jgi:hypothetical protein
MIESLFWFALGLIIGWNFLSQPTMVKAWIDKLFNR